MPAGRMERRKWNTGERRWLKDWLIWCRAARMAENTRLRGDTWDTHREEKYEYY